MLVFDDSISSGRLNVVCVYQNSERARTLNLTNLAFVRGFVCGIYYYDES